MAINPLYFLNYVIFISDAAEYASAIAVAESPVINMTPREAAERFGIPYPYPTGPMDTIPKGIQFFFPDVPGNEILWAGGATGFFIDDAVQDMEVPTQTGNPTSIFPVDGGIATFRWSGYIQRSSQGIVEEETSGGTPGAISQRRWIFGRELSGGGEGDLSLSGGLYTRDASRTIDGVGLPLRGTASSSPARFAVDQFRTGLITAVSWERFYFRVRTLPTVDDTQIWHTEGFPAAGSGFILEVTTTGKLVCGGTNGAGTKNFGADLIDPIVLNQWYKIDVIFKYATSPTVAEASFFVDSVFISTYSSAGSPSGSRHIHSELGKADTSGSDTQVQIDLDDWMCADVPANFSTVGMAFVDENYSWDWLLGSHVRIHRIVSATQTNWTPTGMGVGTANLQPYPTRRLGTAVITSTTSGAQVDGLTDAVTQDIQDTYANVIGAVASVISANTINSTSTDGQLGYRKVGAAAVLATINETSVETNLTVAYLPSGVIIPDEISPWSLVMQKSANVATGTLAMLVCVVEYIGLWGPEDHPDFLLPNSRLSNLHNCRYGNSIYGYLPSLPTPPVYAIGGTFVGNGTYQEITLPAPCHFLMIRAVSPVAPPVWFFAASNGAHPGSDETCTPSVQMFYDLTNELYKFSVVGAASSTVNVSGTTYQYVAFCDPGMRFNLCGAVMNQSALTSKANPLIVTDFAADAGFILKDNSSAVSAGGIYFRGPGNVSNEVNLFTSTTAVANFANLASGVLNTFTAAHSSFLPLSYSLWRMLDSGGVCANTMIQILTYTGNGSSPRNITLTPTSGRFPLLVIVIGGGASLFRDPSHTTVNSSNFSTGANSTSGITATAIDQITISTSLNVNGTVYQIFAICGGITNVNGSYFPLYCQGNLDTGPYTAPSLPLGDINITSEGGLIFNGTTALTLLQSISGIYTLVPLQRHDVFYDRQTGQDNVSVEIPDPTFKTGYIGG